MNDTNCIPTPHGQLPDIQVLQLIESSSVDEDTKAGLRVMMGLATADPEAAVTLKQFYEMCVPLIIRTVTAVDHIRSLFEMIKNISGYPGPVASGTPVGPALGLFHPDREYDHRFH